MIKLSDYLDYLYKEVIEARKRVDRQSVDLANEYAQHPYLKFFRVPRFTIPSVKLDIPLKIDELDAETRYNFKMDEDSFIADVNERIEQVNREKKIDLPPISKRVLKKLNFSKVTDELEKRDHRFVRRPDESINRIDFGGMLGNMNSEQKMSIEASSEKEKEFESILKSSLLKYYTPVSTRLNNIFIDPDTTKKEDKDKILVRLQVEMEEEGLRIVKLQDENGKEFEEIVFE